MPREHEFQQAQACIRHFRRRRRRRTDGRHSRAWRRARPPPFRAPRRRGQRLSRPRPTPASFAATTAQPDGTYTMPGLPAGKYHVTAGGAAQDVVVPVASVQIVDFAPRRPPPKGARSSSPRAARRSKPRPRRSTSSSRCTTLRRCRRRPATSWNSPTRFLGMQFSVDAEPQHDASRRRAAQSAGQRLHRRRQPEGLRRKRRRHRAAAARASPAAAAPRAMAIRATRSRSSRSPNIRSSAPTTPPNMAMRRARSSLRRPSRAPTASRAKSSGLTPTSICARRGPTKSRPARARRTSRARNMASRSAARSCPNVAHFFFTWEHKSLANYNTVLPER